MFAASHKLRVIRRLAVGVTAVSAAAALMAVPAFAAETGTSDIEVGVLANTTFNIVAPAAVTFAESNVTYSSTEDQPINGTLTGIIIEDQRSTATGWSATIESSALTGSVTGTIAANNVLLVSVDNVESVEGSDPEADLTEFSDGTPAALSAPVEFLSAADGDEGKGEYDVDLSVRVVVPDDTAVGTYSGDLTLTIIAGAP